MNFKKLLTTAFALALLAGCTVEGDKPSSSISSPTNNSTSSNLPVISSPSSSTNKPSSSSQNPGQTSSSTTSNPEESTPDVPYVEEYLVRIRTTTGVHVVPSVEKAKKGETVTLTVTLDSGYTLEQLTLNDKVLDATMNGDAYIYTFVMPDADVTVKTKVSVKGDVTLVGDIAVPLALQEDGVTYAAFDVEVNSNSYVAFNVSGNNLSVTQIDRTKSFADIDLAHDKNGGFTLAGGAKYNFFYNPTLGEECCYIVRTEVTRLPSDHNSLWSLFSGSVKSDPSVYPQNLIGVTYSSTESNTSYEWNLYNDNTSFATVKRLGSNSVTANVYKEIKNGVYKVVDTYIESKYDTTRTDDTSAFSARYAIVDTVASEHKNQQMTLHDAEFDLRNPSHDTVSIDFDIMYAYRTGFDMEWNDELKAYTQDISSMKNEDGTFTVTIDSSKSFEISSSITKYEHYEYDVVLNFGKAGELLSGNYLEKVYDNTEYNFSKFEFYPGGEFGGQEVKALEFEYKYGTPGDNNVDFDDSKYFAQSIEATVHNEKLYPNATNTLNETDYVDDYLSIVATPNTALDLWQYRVSESSNHSVIGPRETFKKRFEAKSIGASMLTISNDSTNDVTTKIEVTVAQSVKVRSFYMQGEKNGKPVNDDNVYAAKANILANTVKNVYVAPSPSNAPTKFTATSEDESLLKVTVNGQVMTIDTTGARNISTETTVNINIHSDYYDSWDGFKPTTFAITIIPNGIPSTGAVGTWTNASEGVSVTFTDTASSYTTVSDYKVAYVTYSGGTNVEFAYKFDDRTGVITVSGSRIAGNTFAGTFMFNADGTIFGCLCYTQNDLESGSTLVSDIIGEWYEDEEGYFDDYNSVLVTLTRQ